MSRDIMSASSASSSHRMPPTNSDEGEFNIWKLITRTTSENAFCMTSKFRVNAHVHRIRSAVVTRNRRVSEREKASENLETSFESSSDSSEAWDNFDDEEDDLFELLNMLNEKPDARSAASSIITLSKQYSQSRPTSGVDGLLLEEIANNGTRSQKIYMKKCAEFQITPSKIFLRALNTLCIEIGHQNLGPKGAEACSIALSQNTCIRVLHMNDNDIQYRGAKYVAFMLKENKSITDLNLADNNIGARGAKYLTQVISEHDKIRRLDLSNNGFKEEDAMLFKLMLEETRNLAYLNLSHNSFREKGGEYLGEALGYNDGLEELDLSWNHIRRKGAEGISEGLLDNTSLKRLNLGWNGFHVEGSLGLQKTLMFNTTLEELDLTNNRINRECIEHLTYGLARNSTLRTLVLKCNPLTSEGAHDIIQFINDCPTSGITLLDLGIQQVQSGFVHLINEIHLKKRKFKAIYGHVIGQTPSKSFELEKTILKEHPALVLVEFGKMMGFRLMDLFASMDKNGSRTLDRQEIVKGLKMANIPFSDECIAKMIERLDINGDGEIDFSELLVAQQEYRKQAQKMEAAIRGEGKTRVEETPLWRIKNALQKLVAEKMTDYSSFKRMAELMATQIQKASDELDAKREAITRARARKPRKVRSRPTSPVENHETPVDKKQMSSSDEELKLLEHDQASQGDREKEILPTPRSSGKRMSIQLPVTDLDFLKRSHIKKQRSKADKNTQKVIATLEEDDTDQFAELFQEETPKVEGFDEQDDTTGDAVDQIIVKGEEGQECSKKGSPRRSKSHDESASAEHRQHTRKASKSESDDYKAGHGLKGHHKTPKRRHTYGNLKQ